MLSTLRSLLATFRLVPEDGAAHLQDSVETLDREKGA
jgi:hypothetical protein